MNNFQRIKSIRHLLDSTMCANLCLSLCLSHLDYANSILYGLPDSTINKLRCVQNACAKLALRKGRYDSPTQCMRELHWLPIRQCIAFKILVLTYKCLHDEAPEYFKDLLVILNPSRPGLRSGSTSTIRLLTPKTECKTVADRSLSLAAPTLWNPLPEHLKLCENLLSFKKGLKTLVYSGIR